MRFLRLSIFLLFFCFSIIPGLSQNLDRFYPSPSHPEWFKAIPMIDNSTPEWARTMYLEDDNYEKITRLYKTYYQSNKWEKNIHVQNYKHWLKAVRNYVGEDGKAIVPSSMEIFNSYEKTKTTQTKSNNNTWVNLGPKETFNSDGSTRPTQANIFCIGVSESNPSILYAGMETGGIYKTTDKGLNWLPVSESYAIGSPEEIKVDPLNPDIVYVSDGSSLYKTVDGGNTWNLHYTASDNFQQLFINNTNTDIIYAATNDGLLKSTDAGATWITKFTGYIYDIEAKPFTNDTLYISVYNATLIRPEIFISYDSGENWTLKDNGFYSPSVLADATVYGCKIGVTEAAPNRIYAGIIANGKAGDNGWIGIYYSDDIGESWQNDSGVDGASIDNGDGTWSYPSGDDMNTNWYIAGYSSGYHQGWYNFDIDVSSNDPDKLWIGTIWFCESGNKGQNIEYIRGTRSLSMHADVQDIDVVGNDIWIASDGGLNYSNDECQTMETRMKGIYASDYWGFGQGWNDDIWVGGRYHNGNGAFKEGYGDGNTLFLGGAENPTGYVNPIDNNKTYYSDIGARRLNGSLSDGASSISNISLMPTEAYYHFEYSEMEWHPYKANTMYIGNGNDFYRSEDGGGSFSSLATLPGELRRFEISRDNPDYIYAIVKESYWTWKIFKSTDGGNLWTEVPTPPYNGGSWRNLSFTLNPFNKDEIWLASNSSSNGNKIYSSLDGGNNWTNRYDVTIENQGIKDMIYHASTSGDRIYIMTNDNYFVYDKNTNSYSSYNNGLPVLHTGFMTLPFYRDGKIRMASAKGVWETTLGEPSKVQAMPMINSSNVICSRDTSQLESYSIVNQSGASWLWDINPTPEYISDVTGRSPKVVFGNIGSYDVTLTVNDANGSSDTRTITNFITLNDDCGVDDFAGKSLKTNYDGHSLIANEVNLENITHFSMTGWWKPDGPQQAYAAIASSGDWCAHCDDTEGLIYDYYGSRLWYKWPGNANNWASNSGIEIPQDEWSYVALVITPNRATMYLNDEKYTHNIPLNPGNITDLYIGYGHYSKAFKGEIDELTLWDRALTDDEVYTLKHITKDQAIDTDPNLIAYYQFNESTFGSTIRDKSRSNHATLNSAASLEDSSVPVAGGVSELQELSNLSSIYNFPSVGAELHLSDCDPLDGKVVVSRLNTPPNSSPNNNSTNQYWIINSISDNGEGFSFLDSLKVITTDSTFISGINNVNDIIIHSREEHADANSWIANAIAHDVDSYELSFDIAARVKGDQQIIISNGPEPVNPDRPTKPCVVDTIPGRMLSLPGNSGDYASIPTMNLNTNTLTMSAWIKPNGQQNDWAAIMFSRGNTTTAGLSIKSDNELRYHWNDGGWSWSSGAYVPLDEWSHVALVVEPTAVTIYLNGVPYTQSVANAVEAFDAEIRIGNDATSGSRTFNGHIDEVCIWNRVLSQDEIRLLRHLTKDEIVDTDSDLMAYLQFNETTGKIYDKSTHTNNSILNGGTERVLSNAPVGGGMSDILSINSGGTYNSLSGVELIFNNSGTNPNGEVVFSRINLLPDTISNVSPSSKSYWIINNYGTNQIFDGLTSISFKDAGIITTYSSASQYFIPTRSENGFGLNWTTTSIASSIDVSVDIVTFDNALTINSLGQYVVQNKFAKGWIGVQDTEWSNATNWGGGNIPILTDEVIIPALTPYSPLITTPVEIKSLLIQEGAKVTVGSGTMEVEN